jgi:hypothetical protein
MLPKRKKGDPLKESPFLSFLSCPSLFADTT